jgi:hypothetical protein
LSGGALDPSGLPILRQQGGEIVDLVIGDARQHVGGTVRPSAFAVLRLMASSYFVGAWTGGSAGLVPFRIRPTYSPI